MSKKEIVYPKIQKTEVVIRTVYEKDGVTDEVEETVLLPTRLLFDDDEKDIPDSQSDKQSGE